jgi:hypothetical protein
MIVVLENIVMIEICRIFLYQFIYVGNDLWSINCLGDFDHFLICWRFLSTGILFKNMCLLNHLWSLCSIANIVSIFVIFVTILGLKVIS